MKIGLIKSFWIKFTYGARKGSHCRCFNALRVLFPTGRAAAATVAVSKKTGPQFLYSVYREKRDVKGKEKTKKEVYYIDRFIN